MNGVILPNGKYNTATESHRIRFSITMRLFRIATTGDMSALPTMRVFTVVAICSGVTGNQPFSTIKKLKNEEAKPDFTNKINSNLVFIFVNRLINEL